jgi:hypothetical protein
MEPSEPGGTRHSGGMPTIPSGARMPVPGNAEFAVYFIIEIIFVIIWIAADSVDTHDWVWFTTILTAFYILSRGIAKASRVLEQ